MRMDNIIQVVLDKLNFMDLLKQEDMIHLNLGIIFLEILHTLLTHFSYHHTMQSTSKHLTVTLIFITQVPGL